MDSGTRNGHGRDPRVELTAISYLSGRELSPTCHKRKSIRTRANGYGSGYEKDTWILRPERQAETVAPEKAKACPNRAASNRSWPGSSNEEEAA
jgi:hypothetical protein